MSKDAIGVFLSAGSKLARTGSMWHHFSGRTESTTFAYDETFVASKGSFSIDPQLPLALGAQHAPVGRPLFGAVSDTAPDRWGRTLMQRAEVQLAKEQGRKARNLTEIDYVLGVQDELRQGALRFSQDQGATFLADEPAGVPNLIALGQLLIAAEHVENDAETEAEIKQLVRAGGSLGGARPKAAVRDPQGVLWIAKFPKLKNDDWDVIRWEKLTLDLAERAGVAVSRSALVELGSKPVLLVERFDRNKQDRIHYASAMTMLEASDGESGERSYLELADTIETQSTAVEKDLEELWRRIVFSILVSNTDDHLRNHGFLRVGSGWRLSPAFDINPEPDSPEKVLSLTIDESDRSASLDLALSVCNYFRVKKDRASIIIEACKDAVGTWRDLADKSGIASKDIRRMQNAFLLS